MLTIFGYIEEGAIEGYIYLLIVEVENGWKYIGLDSCLNISLKRTGFHQNALKWVMLK